MVHEISEDSAKKKFSKFVQRNIALLGSIALIPVIAVSFVVVHQQQDLRQHASGPVDFLLYPPDESEVGTDNAVSSTGNGLLRVSTKPVESTTITILKNPENTMVLQMQGQVDGNILPEGNYYISFRKAGDKTPDVTTFSVKAGKSTDIIADFSTGKVTATNKW